MARPATTVARKFVGLGFLPDEARHGFLIDVPKGSGPVSYTHLFRRQW